MSDDVLESVFKGEGFAIVVAAVQAVAKRITPDSFMAMHECLGPGEERQWRYGDVSGDTFIYETHKVT